MYVECFVNIFTLDYLLALFSIGLNRLSVREVLNLISVMRWAQKVTALTQHSERKWGFGNGTEFR